MSRWMVLMTTGPGVYFPYGPIESQEMATRFAEFLTREVDPAQAIRLHDPVDELIAYWHNGPRQRAVNAPEPEHWPPHPGDIWQDREGNRWAMQVETGYLACLARTADDSPTEINNVYGPMHLVYRAIPREEEPPF